MRMLSSVTATKAVTQTTTISVTIPTPSTRTAISACSIDRSEYSELMSYMCVDLTEEWMQRLTEALHLSQAESSALVAVDEFERGVRTCLLLEGTYSVLIVTTQLTERRSSYLELLDTLDQLFHLVDKSESGQTSTQVLLTTLDSAAAIAQVQPESSMGDLLALVHSAFNPKQTSMEPVDELVRWPELLELIARVVFAP